MKRTFTLFAALGLVGFLSATSLYGTVTSRIRLNVPFDLSVSGHLLIRFVQQTPTCCDYRPWFRDRPGLLECGDRSSEAFPYRGRAMFERRPSVAADDCAETQTHPGRPAVAPY